MVYTQHPQILEKLKENIQLAFGHIPIRDEENSLENLIINVHMCLERIQASVLTLYELFSLLIYLKQS